MKISSTCMSCKLTETICGIKESDWKRYLNGELVQNVFPQLDDEERDVLIGARTGNGHVCDECWNYIFGEVG
jgi:hypothetical protein